MVGRLKVQVRYETRMFLDWSADMRKRLRSLTFKGESGMREAVGFRRNPPTCVAFADGIPVGWSLKSVGGWYPYGTPMVYIRRVFRRMGIGTRLVGMVVGGNRKLFKFVSMHDSMSEMFWKKVMRIKSPNRKRK
jgi:hypothetical protein